MSDTAMPIAVPPTPTLGEANSSRIGIALIPSGTTTQSGGPPSGLGVNCGTVPVSRVRRGGRGRRTVRMPVIVEMN